MAQLLGGPPKHMTSQPHTLIYTHAMLELDLLYTNAHENTPPHTHSDSDPAPDMSEFFSS